MLGILLILEPQLSKLWYVTCQQHHELSHCLVHFCQVILNVLDFSQQSRFVPAQIPDLMMKGNDHVHNSEKALSVL